jgi:hypothetical protein
VPYASKRGSGINQPDRETQFPQLIEQIAPAEAAPHNDNIEGCGREAIGHWRYHFTFFFSSSAGVAKALKDKREGACGREGGQMMVKVCAFHTG